jgi:hypothetical protein
MVPKLNQILAIEKGSKQQIYSRVTEAYKNIQKIQILSGVTRSYKKKHDDGEDLPGEGTLVQVKAKLILDQVQNELETLWNITATKDWANCQAKSDVVLEDGTAIMKGVPATYLLFLEKQLVDLRTMIANLPVLDPAHTWEFDSTSNVYRSETVTTHRTRKIPRAFVKYEATEQHPAQVEMFTEDEIVGFWETTKLSGAVEEKDRSDMLERVESVQRAVKMARENANSIEAPEQKISEPMLGYILGN